jgi:uncharacterized protein (TIGR00369 family)
MMPPLDHNPFLTLLGVKLERWEDGRAEFSCELRPELMNRSGAVQGGVIATLIDVACGYSGLYSEVPGEERHAVTITLTVSFANRADSGMLRAVGTRYGGGRKVYFSRAEIFDGKGTLIAAGQCAHKYLPPRRT